MFEMVGIGGTQIFGGSKSWQEDIYWTHFQFIHFTQFLTTDFEQHLALPKTFSNNVKKKLPEKATLKGPSGVVWNIGLKTKDDTVYFTNGWQQFLKDHSLKVNDFLVFKYNGESHFEVLLFDGESCCEKAASYFVGKCGHPQTEQGDNKAKETNNSVEEINTASNGGVECGSPEKFRRLNNIRTPLAVPFETTNGDTFNAGVETASPEKLMADAHTKTPTIQFPFQPTGKRTKKPVNEVTPTPVQSKKRGRPFKAANSCDLVACNKEHSEASILNRSGKDDQCIPSSGASLSMSSSSYEKKIAQSFTSTFPYFVKIMKSFNVSGSRILNVPSKFSKAHLPTTKTKIILRNLKGDQWTVNAVPTTKLQISHTMCGGWLDFVRGNDIKVGDVCIFELIGKCELRVRIAEVGKDGLEVEDSQIGKQASSMLGAKHDVARHKTSSSRYKPKSSKFSSKYRKKVVASDKKLSKIGQEAVSSIVLKKSEVGKEGIDNQNGHVNEP